VETNVAWVRTRLHNIEVASSILFDEAKKLDEIGLPFHANELRRLGGLAQAMRYDLETLRVVIPPLEDQDDSL